MRVYIVARDEKCAKCWWRVRNLYLMADTEKNAKRWYEEDGALCGDCFAEMLASEGFDVLAPKGDEER
jgi:hypothetical protein